MVSGGANIALCGRCHWTQGWLDETAFGSTSHFDGVLDNQDIFGELETEVKDLRKSRYSFVAAVLRKLALDGTLLSRFEETSFRIFKVLEAPSLRQP